MKPFDYFIFRYDNDINIPEIFRFKECVNVLKLEEIQQSEATMEHYGLLSGLYYIWKKENVPYIGFSFSNHMINPNQSNVEELLSGNVDVLLLKSVNIKTTLQERYRRKFFGYDYNVMMEILRKYEPLYYEFAKKQIFLEKKILPFTGIMKKELFRKYCSWLFRLLKNCDENIYSKTSKYQNRYLEHLSEILFFIYFKYNEKKLKIKNILDVVSMQTCQLYDKANLPEEGNLYEQVQKLLNCGALEQAEYYINKSKEPCAKELKIIFEKYHAQRHYYKQTLFEKTTDLGVLLKEEGNGLPKVPLHGKKRALIFLWASITHLEAVAAFEALGFECESVEIKYEDRMYDEKFLDDINNFLDKNSYDIVYSINYFAMISEACYVHGVPYVAWCYDSPTFIGDLHYLKYPTTHTFFFDSLEAEEYRAKGIENVYYMPLAVNVERYDKLICTQEDIKKYQADISFVGSLYDSNFKKAFQHLDDYKMAYLNALVENQMGRYNCELYSAIITPAFMKWISQKEFNQVLNSSWDKKDSTSLNCQREGATAGRLRASLSRYVTNRERILLISMLANHWDFKLYSTSGHEVFKNVKECGVVEYYKEMPKVFKNSRINLNITLHSILAGIPLRCLDIMGCHGLLLTNYQRDFEEHFKDHDNILFYHSIEEAYDKTKYYLEHEDERQKIENKGYETVKNYYNYKILLPKVLSMSGLDYLLV